MKKPIRAAILRLLGAALLLALTGGAFAAEETDPAAGLREAFDAAPTLEDKLVVLEAFLAEHPDNEAAPDALGGLVWLLDDRLDRHDDAVAAVIAQLERTSDPELDFRMRELLLDLYSTPEHAGQMIVLVDEMYADRAMTFGDHTKVIEAALGAEAWGLAEARCHAAAPTASTAAFKADYPDEDFDPAYVAAAGANRAGMIATFLGWAVANQGRYDEAELAFAAADRQVRRSYLDLPTNDLYRYWGATDLMREANAEGLERLALAAIFAGDHDAEDLAGAAFAELHGADADFTAYLWDLREKFARTIEGFTATDYAGQPVEFAAAKGRRATLLAFWFPT